MSRFHANALRRCPSCVRIPFAGESVSTTTTMRETTAITMEYGLWRLPAHIHKQSDFYTIYTYLLYTYLLIYIFGIAPCHAPQQARHSHATAWAIYPLRTSWMLSPCSASRRPEILKSSTHLKFMVSSCCCCSACCCCCRLVVAIVAVALLHVAAGQHFSGFCLCIFPPTAAAFTASVICGSAPSQPG